MDSRTTWPALIGALVRGDTLTAEETSWAMNEIMDGAATPSQIAGFGVALRMKGETPAEMTGLAQAMLAVLTPDALRRAVATEDLVALMSVPGIGRKGAQRIVLELAGRLGAPCGVPSAAGAVVAVAPPQWQDQVRWGLMSLGWGGREADLAIASVATELISDTASADLDVAVALRAALRVLGRS